MPNRPAHEIRIGKVKAVIWKNLNSDTDRAYYSVGLAKLYRQDGSWKESSHFSRDDLPLLAKVADRAHSWIYEQS